MKLRPDPDLSQYIKPLRPIATGLRQSGRRLHRIRAVLFDIYGTLIISAAGDIGVSAGAAHFAKLNRLFGKFRIDRDPRDVAADLSRAIESDHRAKRKKGILFPEVEIDRIWMQVLGTSDAAFVRQLALEYELTVNPVYGMPGLEELLRACRAKKLQTGLISNAQFYTNWIFKWLLGAEPAGLGFHPELILLSYRLGRAKPSPALFEAAAAALAQMGIAPAQVLYTGNDMLKDILPAVRAGFRTALFAGDRRSLRLREDEPACRNLSADLVLTGLMQIFEYID